MLLGFLLLLIFNSKSVTKRTKESITVSVILKNTATEAEILELQKKLDASEYCKSTQYKTKEEAANELTQELGEDFESILEYNPLPASIDFKLYEEYANLDSIANIETKLTKENIITDIFYHKALLNTVNNKLNAITTIISFVGLIFFFIAIFLINNTVRLTLFAKRFIIKTMQLVGATNNFIMKPFLIKSLFHGAISSALAIILLIITIIYLQNNIENITQITSLAITFVLVFLIGITTTLISTYISIIQYINTKIEKLYY